jgi:hypothetical protein
MKNNKQQTSVEWFAKKVMHLDWKFSTQKEKEKIIQQAKEMEKERLTDAYCDGKSNGMDISHPLSLTKEISANEWYNETYGGGEQ